MDFVPLASDWGLGTVVAEASWRARGGPACVVLVEPIAEFLDGLAGGFFVDGALDADGDDGGGGVVFDLDLSDAGAEFALVDAFVEEFHGHFTFGVGSFDDLRVVGDDDWGGHGDAFH